MIEPKWKDTQSIGLKSPVLIGISEWEFLS